MYMYIYFSQFSAEKEYVKCINATLTKNCDAEAAEYLVSLVKKQFEPVNSLGECTGK